MITIVAKIYDHYNHYISVELFPIMFLRLSTFTKIRKKSSLQYGYGNNFHCWSTDGQTDGRTDGQTDGQTDGRTDGQTDGRTDGRTDGWTDRRTDGRTGGRTDGRKDRRTDRDDVIAEWSSGDKPYDRRVKPLKSEANSQYCSTRFDRDRSVSVSFKIIRK